MDTVVNCTPVQYLGEFNGNRLWIKREDLLGFSFGGNKARKAELFFQGIRLLEELPAENNYILRQWKECGLEVSSAADSQALIQLKRQYCDRTDCLRCRFGYEYLKGSSQTSNATNANVKRDKREHLT